MGVKIKYDECPEVLRNFLDYLLHVRLYSEHTVCAYCLDLLCFFGFLREYLGLGVPVKGFTVFMLLRVKEADVIAFLVYLNFYRDNTASTRQRRLVCIRRFYKWLLGSFPSDGMRNPAKGIAGVKGMVRLPKYLRLEEAKRMLGVFTVENSLYPLRNNLIVLLLLQAGLRVSELSDLNVGDVDLEGRCLEITGKGNKERRVPIHEKTKEELARYFEMEVRKGGCVEGNRALLVGHRNERLGVAGVERVCKRAFELVGLKDKGYTAHSLRHTAATIVYGCVKSDILLVKEFLGHSSIGVTQVYTHVCDDRIREAFERNPLSDFLADVA